MLNLQKKAEMKGKRASNIELLRIIAMAMILALHIGGASLGLPHIFKPSDASAFDWGKQIVEAFSIVGVNVFVLISGFFSIKFSWRGLWRYVAWCAIYSIGIYAGAMCVYHSLFTWKQVTNAVLVFSRSDLWFVREYLFLYLISGLINVACESMSRSQLKQIVCALLLISCYFGWALDCKVNQTGYNLVQLITIYIIGRYLGLHCKTWLSDLQIKNRVRVRAIGAFVVATGCTILMSCFVPSVKAFAYNSPFVIVAAVALFVAFTTLQFSSKVVNYVASSAFAVYLIHKNPLVWGNLLRPSVVAMHSAVPNGALFFLCCVALTIGIFVVCIVIDKIRLALFSWLAAFCGKKA